MNNSTQLIRPVGYLLAFALALTLTTTATRAQNTFTVTGVCCTAYDIDGQDNPALTVVRGQTYSFNLINCAFHPFNIQSTPGIGGTQYANVANNGGTDGTVTLTVPIDEPADTLYYQCGNHVPMNGTLTVIDPPMATPTSTPTAIPVTCVGDCNGDGTVTVDELLAIVNIALGEADVSTCSAGDANQDGQITVNEVLSAVNSALNGCNAG